MGNALKRGIPVAIVGRPNAGKSSLLNALLGDDRAIVSDIPGTTRDTIEETLTIDGITFRFIDTAGLRHSDDTIEALGIERTRKAISDAYLVLYVHDATTRWEEPALDFSDKKVIVALNKSDLQQPTTRYPLPTIIISAKTGLGLDNLRAAMLNAVRVDMPPESDILLSNARHHEALLRVQHALDNVTRGLDTDTPADLLAVDLRDALYHLGTVTGEVTSDEVLGNIFGRFCIGK